MRGVRPVVFIAALAMLSAVRARATVPPPGEKPYIVAVRFTLAELDARLKK